MKRILEHRPKMFKNLRRNDEFVVCCVDFFVVEIVYNVDVFFLSRSGNMRHSPSEPVLHQRSHSTSRSSSLTRNRPDLTTPIHVPKMKSSPMNSILPSSYFSMNSHELIPSLPDKSSNLDPDDFLPVLTDMFQQTNSKS